MTEIDSISRLTSSGANQTQLRDQNARVVLSYIRRYGALAGAEIARRSGLSPQTVSNILRVLDADGLIRRGDAIKGRVGKPSVPVQLNPQGAFSIGLNIGRRSAELVLVDFLGHQVDAEVVTYAYPSINGVFDFLARAMPAVIARNQIDVARLAGIGVARPNRIWDWLEFVSAPEGSLTEWKEIDLAAEVRGKTGLDVVIENDATSACVAEQLIGRGHEFHSFAYIFVGTFVGGGLVLDGKIVSGRTNNAAAIGPLPVPDGKGGTVQLLDVASLHVLERELNVRDLEVRGLRDVGSTWDEFGDVLDDWLTKTGQHLAIACAAIASIVEVDAILIEGAIPAHVRARLTSCVRDAYGRLDITGIEKPRIEEAAAGRRSRSVGAALLPIHARYFVT